MDPVAEGSQPRRPRAFGVAAVVALCQALALIGNGTAIAYLTFREGITAPDEVSSPAGVAFEVMLYLLFGGAMLWLARSFLAGRTAGLTGFALAQVLGLALAVPLAQAAGGAGTVGRIGVVLCAAGLAAWGSLLRHAPPYAGGYGD